MKSIYTRGLYYISLVIMFVWGVEGSRSYADTLRGPSYPVQKQAYVDLLYERANVLVPQENAEGPSSLFHHIWMAYLIDSTQPAILEAIANVYAFARLPEKAYPYLEAAYKYSECDPYIGKDLLNLSVGLNKWETVIELGTKLTQKSPKDLSVLNTLLRAYSETKQQDKVTEVLDKLQNAGGASPQILFQKADVLVKSGKGKEAILLIQKHLKEHPKDKSSAFFAPSYFAEIGYENESRALLKNLRKQYPEDIVGIYALQASLDLRKGDYQSFSRTLLEAAHIEGVTPEDIQAFIAEGYKVAGNNPLYLDALIPVERELMKIFPESDYFATLLAGILLQKGEEREADKILKELLRKGSDNPTPYLYKAEQYSKENKLDSLLSFCEKAVEKFPQEPAFRLYAIFSYIQKNDHAKALAEAEKSLTHVSKDAPQYCQIQGIMADLLLEKGEVKKAFELYEKALRMTTNPLIANNYAYALATKGEKSDLNKAEEYASKAIKIEPGQAAYLDTYAWILYLKGDYSLAKIYQESAISNSPEPNALYYEHYGDILSKLGDTEAALKAYKQALSLSEEKEEIQKRIDVLKKK